MIRLFCPYIPNEAVKYFESVIASGNVAQGPQVDEFEKMFSEKFSRSFCVSMNSGTSALETAYEMLDLKPGDDVITTPLTCSATNIPLLRRGVRIVWADVDRDTLCISDEDIRRKITPFTKAIVQVHLGGIQARLDSAPFYRESGDSIPVVSDACQALGVFSGDYTCCSFQAIKHITTGDGGMLVVPTQEEYKKAKLIRWFGIDRERMVEPGWQSYKTRMMSFDIEVPGCKRQMNDIAASLGIVGLNNYDYVMSYRRNLFNMYKSLLKDVPGLKVVDGPVNSCWLCTMLVERRDDFAKMLFDAGVETNIVQVRNDTYKIFGGIRQDLPVMNEIEDKYISLPLHMKLTEDDVRYICDKIKRGWQ
jgi:perosamine synthetase